MSDHDKLNPEMNSEVPDIVQTAEAVKPKHKPITPVAMLWFLALLGVASTIFSVWGLWRITDLSVQFQSKDDRSLVLAVNLKEEIASFSMLTYDFLLQQDFNRMMLKERQSNKTREDITQNLGNLAMLSTSGTAGTVIEAIRYNITSFLAATDKALETAVEDGNATKARGILQDEVEPALKTAQNSLNDLINSRQHFGDEHFQFVRQQSIMIILLLVGLTTLGMAIIVTLRSTILHKYVQKIRKLEIETEQAASTRAPSADEVAETRKRILEARSLSTLALINRLNRLHKDSEELKKDIQVLQRHADSDIKQPPRVEINRSEVEILQHQGEKIAMSLGRIGHINDQTKHFVDSIGELMHGMQGLATDGNVVALNVTIELAKLQAHLGAPIPEEKNAKISEQIRALATTAASITGKMAMVLSQFRYAQQDFEKQSAELAQIKSGSSAALDTIKNNLHIQQQQNSQLFDERTALLSELPKLVAKVAALEEQITQIQAMTEEEIDELGDMPTGRQFKIISGGAS
ncbi:MAG: MCP four helix bundle domain-containing protein [Alphaproteobacteria bacterium]|nr:MCP four helix bundle domain-containing protein [Alphaproteobacteria bacterium]